MDAEAVSAMAMAAKGNASFSFVKAAVPKPCAAAPIPRPRATASLILAKSSKLAPKFAPRKSRREHMRISFQITATNAYNHYIPRRPVTTTMLTAKLKSAPNIPAIAIAKGLVIFRLSKERRSDSLPMHSKRTAAAVPKILLKYHKIHIAKNQSNKANYSPSK